MALVRVSLQMPRMATRAASCMIFVCEKEEISSDLALAEVLV